MQDKPPSILFVIPYFGKWPFWFDFFLTSCGWNSKIHWLIYTDCGVPEKHPANVRFIEISFGDYCNLVSDRLGLQFSPSQAYKLCDVKAAIGAIHEKDLESYDYFGFCDIDVVYGDLWSYLRPRIAKYNLVSTHDTRVAGHLTVMRNIPEMRNAFQRVKNWREEFEKQENVRFDEKHYSKIFIKHKNWPKWARAIFDRGDFYRRTSLLEEAFSTPGCAVAWHDQTFEFPAKWYCRSNSLTNNQDGTREFPYLHFLWWKGYVWTHVENQKAALIHLAESEIEQGWQVSETGFSRLPESGI